MIIDCISDLHGFYPNLDGGDLLIIAGDFTAHDEIIQYEHFFKWLSEQNYRKVVLVAGNHDNKMQNDNNKLMNLIPGHVDYLCDSHIEFEEFKIYGSPWTMRFANMNSNCMAFTCENEYEISQKFDLIPIDVNILVTHSPPFSILDSNIRDKMCGSISLKYNIQDLLKYNNLKLHVFGHIHEQGGKVSNKNRCRFVNVCHVNENYEPVNNPFRMII